MNESELAAEIADHYGLEHQVEKMIEELEELIEAAREWQQGPKADTCKSLIEEISDVRLMTWQVLYLHLAFSQSDLIIKQKIRRQLKRMESEAND